MGDPLTIVAQNVLIFYLFIIFLFGLAVFNVRHLIAINDEDIYNVYKSTYVQRFFFILLPIVPFLPKFKNCYSNPKNIQRLLEALHGHLKINLLLKLAKTGKLKEVLDLYFDIAPDMPHECCVQSINEILNIYTEF